jgi:polysaccharide export outer membrane protein
MLKISRNPRFKFGAVSRPAFFAVLITCLAACTTTQPPLPPKFKAIERASSAPLLGKEELALLEESVNPVYRIGAGDMVRLDVFGRPDVSGKQVVGPDGRLVVQLAGEMNLSDLTREEARALIEKRLRPFYTAPHVTLTVEEYVSNQVTVLGRVERAGMLKFPHSPTLAEVLASAGAMPILDKQATLTRCAILRGREKLIWVDLKAMLNGDPAYNIRMKKGDIVFIPDSADTAVYVLGQVTKPGSYRLTPRMTLLDAIAQAGGPSEDGKPEQIGVYRAGAADVQVVPFKDLIDPSRALNFAIEDGDVVFVPRGTMAEIGYVMRQLSPAMSVLSFGATLKAVSK